MKPNTKPRKPISGIGSQESNSISAKKASLTDALPYDAGWTTKDSRYKKRLFEAIEGDGKHPIHRGISMQAHHVLSETGMHRSGLADKIRKFGYNINLLDNLVFLPSTLQGACYLGVQPHRGNHIAPADPDNYANDIQPMGYHDLIGRFIRDLQLGLTKECPGYLGGAQELEARAKVKHELDTLSEKVLRLIQNSPKRAPLTSVAAHFQPGNPVGCAGTDSTTTHVCTRQCSVGRNHLGRQGPGQKAENITYESDGRFALQLRR